MYMCGVYLQTGRLVAAFAFIPISLMFYGTWTLLKIYDFNPRVCEETGRYMLSNGLAILFFGLFDV